MLNSATGRAAPALVVFSLISIPSVSAAGPRVPEGFEVRLVAEVPAVEFPSQVATAPDGSLFVAEDPMDQRGPYEAFDGRILRFRDGQEPIRFAEGFRAIQGMAWHDGALYVCHMPFLTILRDTDGDGTADQKKHLFEDLGPTANKGLNDHIVSGIQFGIDGWLYISVGDKGVPGATRPEDGVKVQLKGGGTLRCRPNGTELEVFSSGTRNHLEANLDAADNLFTYDNTDDGDGWWTRVTHHIYQGYYGYPYDYHDHPERFLPRMAEYGGGSPCGAVFYREDAWPEAYRGVGFWAEWGKGKVHAFRFRPKGASFEIAEAIDFAVPSGTKDFRPIDLAVSYDGTTLYIADWNMGGWGRDERVGRVWAVTYTGAVPTEPRGSDSDPIPAQIAHLNHESYNERMRAQNALIHRGAEALPAVLAALKEPDTPERALRHLVWVVDGIAGGTPEGSLPLIDALESRSAEARCQAARALGERRVPIAVEPLIGLVNDPEPRVRLQAITALNRLADRSAVPQLVAQLGSDDPFLAFAARQALRHIEGFLEIAALGLMSEDPRVRTGVALTCSGIYEPSAVAALMLLTEAPGRPVEERARALALLSEVHRQAKPWDGRWWGTRPTQGKPPARTETWAGTPLVLQTVRRLLDDQAPELRQAAIEAVTVTGDREALPALRRRFPIETDPAVQATIARTIGQLADVAALPQLVAAIKNVDSPDRVREAALSAVETIGTGAGASALLDLLRSARLPEAWEARVIGVLGRLKPEGAVPLLIDRLESPSAEIRKAAVAALGTIGRPENVGEILRRLIEDPVVSVRAETIAALGRLQDRGSIPALIAASAREETRFAAMNALTTMPDVRALQVLLRGLTDRNADLRKASATAIGRIRDQAAPVLDRLAERKELAPRVVGELRKVFAGVKPISDWRLIGPFEKKAAPPFALDASLDLEAEQTGLEDRKVRWRPVRRTGENGRIDLGRLYGGDQRSAFGYAEIRMPENRAVELVVGSDDTLTVWLNGKEIYSFQGDRGYEPEQARVTVDLTEGTNRLIVRCGNSGGGWLFSVGIAATEDYAFLKAPAEGAFDPESYRDFATRNPGNADRGRALFADLKGLACIKCHTVQGQGGTVGPDLSGVAALYGKDELITSVLYPSARIFSGYEPVTIATSDGKVLTGVLKSDTPEAIEIQDAEANRITIPSADIEERKAADVSIMPSGLAEGLSREDFADLIAYLEGLKQAPPTAPKPAAER